MGIISQFDYVYAHFILYQWVRHDLILPKTESYYLKHIQEVNFYPSDNNSTQALLVMLVTNMISGPYESE